MPFSEETVGGTNLPPIAINHGSTTYRYIYNGSSLSQMTVGSNTLYFAYDAAGTPLSVTWNDTVYYYVTNIQGDVVVILNSSGAPVVYYRYDAWGNPVSVAGSMADTLGTLNPLRYRGYIYDQETGLYYLQSRYYNPTLGRFLNVDIVFDYDVGAQGYNLFIYCGNNPINRIDISGTDSVAVADLDLTNDQLSEKESGAIKGSGNHSITTSSTSTTTGKGFSSHRQFKREMGSHGEGNEWHHIVEQCQITKSGFAPETVHNTKNIVPISQSMHRAISGYYSSKQQYTGGLRVRDWLAGQSFAQQTAYGWYILNMHMKG